MRQPVQPFVYRIKISGEAGDGIMTAGDILMKAAARQGFDTTVAKSFPSNIRGGYTQSFVTIADDPIVSPLGDCDILFVLSPDAFLLDTVHLKPQTLIIVETAALSTPPCRERFDRISACGHTVVSVPLLQFARETAGSGTTRSTVALGILGELLRINKELLDAAVTERFKGKGVETVELNHLALESGFFWARQHCDAAHRFSLPQDCTAVRKNRLVLEGNEAVALGAISAGCTFYASYPITPATAIGETLALLMPLHGGFAYQAEDEIAALGSAIGASFSGGKAMTATSGPGLSLMQEFLGYASMVELPVVVVDVQRVGPSTGMPTKHSQDDLLAAIFGGHGEGQRIVIAPASVEDCFHSTVEAFNCAEHYQCPVIVLSDSTLGMMKAVLPEAALKCRAVVTRKVFAGKDKKQSSWRRCGLTESGINPVTIPGRSPFTYRATGIEHDEDFAPVTTPRERSDQIARRFRKLRHLETEMKDPVVWDIATEAGAPVDFGVCAWGFTAAATREAVVSLRKQGHRIAAIYPRLLFPVCVDALDRWAHLCPLQIVVEANYTGQFRSLITMFTNARPLPLTVARGEPFTPHEIEAGILHIIGKGRSD